VSVSPLVLCQPEDERARVVADTASYAVARFAARVAEGTWLALLILLPAAFNPAGVLAKIVAIDTAKQDRLTIDQQLPAADLDALEADA